MSADPRQHNRNLGREQMASQTRKALGVHNDPEIPVLECVERLSQKVAERDLSIERLQELVNQYSLEADTKDRQIADLQREAGLLREAINKVQQLQLGQYWIAPHPLGGHWIEIAEGDGCGEGMQTMRLAELIDKFYTENF